MNPSGDFGKRELSPALRNRFTEIWVEPITSRKFLAIANVGNYNNNNSSYSSLNNQISLIACPSDLFKSNDVFKMIEEYLLIRLPLFSASSLK